MEDSTVLKAVAIGSLAILEVVALLCGIDGALLSVVIAAIAGLAGYETGKRA